MGYNTIRQAGELIDVSLLRIRLMISFNLPLTQVIKPLTDDFRIIEGWVVDSKSRRLFWVPPALRDGLMRPSEVLIIGGRFTRTKLDATQFKCGKSWKKCRSSA